MNDTFIAALFDLSFPSATRDILCFFLHQARPVPTSFGGSCLCQEVKTAAFSYVVGDLVMPLSATRRRIRHLPFRYVLPLVCLTFYLEQQPTTCRACRREASLSKRLPCIVRGCTPSPPVPARIIQVIHRQQLGERRKAAGI